VNLCRACDSDFTSVETFDAHRVGKHAYTYEDGLKLDPSVEDGRRCLDAEEMLALGWRQEERGRWVNVARAERARRAFSEKAA
jgi:hypothetical protein